MYSKKNVRNFHAKKYTLIDFYFYKNLIDNSFIEMATVSRIIIGNVPFLFV